jgi:hypothetical protein
MRRQSLWALRSELSFGLSVNGDLENIRKNSLIPRTLAKFLKLERLFFAFFNQPTVQGFHEIQAIQSLIPLENARDE